MRCTPFAHRVRSTPTMLALLASVTVVLGCEQVDAIRPAAGPVPRESGMSRSPVPGAMSRVPLPGPMSAALQAGEVSASRPMGVPMSGQANDTGARFTTLTDNSPRIVWQSSSSGERASLLMNGTTFSDTALSLPTRPIDWHIVASADFFHDGQADLVWQNSITGERSLWYMNGNSYSGVNLGLPSVTADWSIAATTDFNTDGHPDILWENLVTGERAIWMMSGNVYLGISCALPSVSVEWRIAAAVDMNDDGTPDLLWQNTNTGDRSIWLMDGTTYSGTAVSLPVMPTDWTMVAAADFNADGKSDILWSNGASGARTIWFMNGTVFSGAYADLPAAPAGWQMATVMAPTALPVPASAVKISGDSMWLGGVNVALPAVPQRLRVFDASSTPLANVRVTFSIPPNGGSQFGVDPAGTVVIVHTNSEGIASLPVFRWLPFAPTATIAATVQGLPTPMIFTAFRGPDLIPMTACELSKAGAAYCTGVGANGAIGDGGTVNRATFTAVAGGHAFTALAEGIAAHHCGLVGITAYCWGNNVAGQLGDGTTTNRKVPTAVAGGLAFLQLYAQGNTTCGLTSGRQLYCWGNSGSAGWGDGEALRGRNHSRPTLVNTGSLGFKRVVVLDDGVCGLTADRAIHCRGAAHRGLNGDGTVEQRTAFTTWIGGPWSDLGAGNINACALDIAGHAWCVGSNQAGALGFGVSDPAVVSVPTRTGGDVSFVSVKVSNLSACARTSGNDVYCWGGNGAGQAGIGSFNYPPIPTKIELFSVVTLRATTFRNYCGKAANGQLYCWGGNGAAQGAVGDGTVVSRPSPVAAINWPDGPPAGTPVSMYPPYALLGGPPSGVVAPLPTVTVKDRFGTPVAGVLVNFAANPGSGVVTGGSVITNASGVATVGSWTLPGVLGTAQLIVTSNGVPALGIPAIVTSAPALTEIMRGSSPLVGNSLPTRALLPVRTATPRAPRHSTDSR